MATAGVAMAAAALSLFSFERNFGVGEITEIPLILMDGANVVRLGDLTGTKLIRW